MFDAEICFFVGSSLSLFGILILVIDMTSDKMKLELQNVTLHLGRIDQQIKELEVVPKDRGYILEGENGSIDIGQSLEILEDAAKEANKKNKEIELNLIEKIRDNHSKHMRARLVASILVSIGSVLSFIGGILQ